MIWFYRILFIPGLLIALPYYLRRMLKRGGYSKDFSHRFGGIPALPAKEAGVKRIWIQAVSVGELRAIKPLIESLSKKTNTQVILTTTTSTGYEIAKELYKNQVARLGIFPLDFWPFSARTWKHLKPDLAVLMEGELWPEHLTQAEKHNVPVALINARLSDRSFKRYKKAKCLAFNLLSKVKVILPSSAIDGERFASLCKDPSKVIPGTGNLKFDSINEELVTKEELMILKYTFGFSPNQECPLILLGSSTWPGEEDFLIKTFKKALKKHIDCRLLLVPRHAERRKELESILKASKLNYHFRSAKHQATQGTQVYVADTTGELASLSQAADLAFIGKSLAPNNGGQTPIEAATYAIPMVYGPKMSNFKEVCRSLEGMNAAFRCPDAETASSQLIELLENAQMRKDLGARAKAWHSSNQGATERTIEALQALLN